MTDPIIGLPTGSRRCGGQQHVLGKAYSEATRQAGGVPLLIPPLEDEQPLRRLYDQIDGLLLCGGGDVDPACYGDAGTGKLRSVDRRRDRTEMILIRWALDDRLPVLGICRGIQALNVAAGGTLVQDIPSEVPGALQHGPGRDIPRDHLAHEVLLEPGSLLAAVLAGESNTGEFPCLRVNSRHHQAVKVVAPGFAVSARAPDGVIEGIESISLTEPGVFVVGVQWHPEDLVPRHDPMMRLFWQFVDGCRT